MPSSQTFDIQLAAWACLDSAKRADREPRGWLLGEDAYVAFHEICRVSTVLGHIKPKAAPEGFTKITLEGLPWKRMKLPGVALVTSIKHADLGGLQ